MVKRLKRAGGEESLGDLHATAESTAVETVAQNTVLGKCFFCEGYGDGTAVAAAFNGVFIYCHNF